MDVGPAEHQEGDEEMPHLDEEIEEVHHGDSEEEADAGELEAHYSDAEELAHGGGGDDEDGVEDEEQSEDVLETDGTNIHGEDEGVEEEEADQDEDHEMEPPNIVTNAEPEDDAVENEDGHMEDLDDESTLNNNNQDEIEESEVEGGAAKRKRSASHSSVDEGPKRKQVRSSGSVGGQKHDTYCWVCHKDGVQAFCKICPRSYHSKCMHVPEEPGKGTPQAESSSKACICPECAVVMNAENLETRSETMKKLTVDQLICMLKYACQRMKTTPGAEPFLYPVDPAEALDYFKYVVYPMDLTNLENNVKKRQYGSTEAFLADAQWLVHNSVVFNSVNSPFTAIAKKILKVCRQEIQDIETCPECYVNAHNKPEIWFVEACKRPHILVWAKLKGFPFWPAKAMRVKDEMVDVRFFGAHDRAWVVRKDCFLYSEENPSTAPPKRNTTLLTAIDELNAHVQKLKEANGPVVFAATRTPIGPQLSLEQIRKMLPEYKPDEPSSKAASAGLAQPVKKSPMTIRISLKNQTNPTIVTNSVVEESAGGLTKPKLRKTTVAVNASEVDDKQEDSDNGQHAASPEKDSFEEEKLEMKDELDQEEEDPSSAEEESETVEQPKPIGILATALSGRPTRRSSRSETGSTSPAGGVGDLRMLRAVLRPDPESGDENSKEQRDATSTPPPPKSFLKSLGLMKSSDVKKKPVVVPQPPQLGKLLHPSEVFVKDEQEDDDYGETTPVGGGHRKANELMNQGMRFNLSKDISISPVGDDSGEDNHHHPQQQPRRMIQGHSARLVPGLIPQNVQMMGGRPRQLLNTNGGGIQQRLQQQQQGQRIIMRPRPGGVPMRPGMRMNGPRPQSMQMMQMKTQQQQGQKPKDGSTLVIDSSSLQAQGAFANAVQLNQVQSIQGAITLPGGTITVTPLAPVIGVPISDGSLNSGQVVVKQNITNNTNGLPISVINAHDGTQSLLKSNNKPNPQRRNLMNQVPSAVGHLVQNLQKTLVENVKTTMEQIVVEMLEKANSSGGGSEAKSLKEENERLKKQVVEQKHNQDSVVREVKEALIADKKRALAEQRKQLEAEKNKAVEETKKKQWCARCGREAQFYCCWNTSYCGYPCQEDHWPSHMNSCSQGSGGGRQ